MPVRVTNGLAIASFVPGPVRLGADPAATVPDCGAWALTLPTTGELTDDGGGPARITWEHDGEVITIRDEREPDISDTLLTVETDAPIDGREWDGSIEPGAEPVSASHATGLWMEGGRTFDLRPSCDVTELRFTDVFNP